MDVGGFLQDTFKDAVNTAGQMLVGYQPFQDRVAPAAPANPNPSFMDRLGAGFNNTPVLKEVANATTWAEDHFAPLKFALDLPNQGMDSLFGGFAAMDAGNSFASGWAKSWDSFGQPGHVTAGEIIGANLNNTFNGNLHTNLDPTTTQGVQQLHQLAHGTWYGDIAGGVSDLLAGFIGPATVAGGVVKGTRFAGEIATAAEADKAATAFNAAHAAGDLDELSKGTAFFSQKSPQTLAARMRDSARDMLDHSASPSDAMDYIAPRMEGANENTKRIMATVAHEAYKIPDRQMGEHVLANAWFAAMGSDAAKAELIASHPLIANSIAEASAPPSVLADMTKAQQLMMEGFKNGGDIRPSVVMQQVFDTPRKVAVRQALGEAMDKAKQDAIEMKNLRQRLYNLKPVQRVKNADGTYTDNFDTARLKEARANAVTQVQNLTQKLAEAKADLQGTQRFAGAADKKVAKEGVSGLNESPYKDAKEFNQALGAAQQRVDSLTEQLTQAKADRDLLHQTPLHDPDEMDNWRKTMAGARQGTKEAMLRRDMLQAMYRISGRAIRDDLKNMQTIRPGLNMTNQWLADIDQLGEEGASFVGRVTPTMLDAAKAGFREHVGRTYFYQTDDYTPNVFYHVLPLSNKQLANIGTEYGLNRVQTLDRYRGSQELRMSLRRSGEFSGDEIKAASDRFIRATPNNVQQVVSELQDEMLARIARSEGISPETGRKIINQTNIAMGGVRAHLAMELQKADAEGNKVVKLHEFPNDDSSDAIHVISAASIRSHLADTTSFLDPHHARRLMRMENGPGVNWSKILESADGALYITNYIWKIAALARPGLFFRNMLDTGIRSMALMGTTASMMSSVNGTLHKIRNDGIRVGDWATRKGTARGDILDRIGLHQPEDYSMRILGDKGIDIETGKGKTANVSLFDRTKDRRVTPESLAATRSAEQRGAFVHNSLFGAQERITNQIHKQYAVWDKYAPDHKLWPEAYAEHLGVLMASPTVRAILNDVRLPAPPGGLSAEERIKRLFSDPAVRDEYANLGLPNNASRHQFIEQLDHEIELMFPENRLIEDVLDGKVQGARGEQWIQENFPPGMRFQIPGPMSVLEKGPDAFKNLARGFINKAFSVLMDEPDFWLVRHPVAVHVFSQQIKREASTLMEARRAKFGDDAEITPEDIRKITARARTKAITTVRNYGYDTTHNSVFSQNVHRVAPFYNVFQDVLRAYSKLIYDDPQRLHLLSGLYNAPVNVSQWMPQPLVTDVNGKPLRPGEEPADGRRMIVLNSLIGGKTPFGGVTQRINLSSLNAILMSEVPWLPGWGPTAQVPITAFFNSQKELGLQLSNSKNPVIQDLMKSFYPGGNIPKGDPASLLESFVPPVWRHVIDGYMGDTYWKNVQYGLNQAYIDAEQHGERFDFTRALDKAKSDANMANTMLLVAQGIFGLSGDTSVEGHFYVNQMHALQALPISELHQRGYPSVQAAFSAMFPEAAHLDWSFTQNDTGISATFQAQNAALKNEKLIQQFPKLGWFVVGGENVAGDFSMSAYNQQVMSGGRSVIDPKQQMEDTQAAMGWQEYMQYTTAVNQLAQQYGLDDNTVLALKEMKIFGVVQGAPGDRVSIAPDSLAARNPAWYRAYNVSQDDMANFYNEADRLANSPQLRNRQDMAMYRQYREAQQTLMQQAGLKDLGTGVESAAIRYLLNQIGQQMASQNIGFEQMWERMLSKDVKPRPTDSRFNFGISS